MFFKRHYLYVHGIKFQICMPNENITSKHSYTTTGILLKPTYLQPIVTFLLNMIKWLMNVLLMQVPL